VTNVKTSSSGVPITVTDRRSPAVAPVTHLWRRTMHDVERLVVLAREARAVADEARKVAIDAAAVANEAEADAYQADRNLHEAVSTWAYGAKEGRADG
jgi:hypothetical protein